MRVIEAAGDFVCTVCGAIVPHEQAAYGLTPLQHDAPCGRPCAGGGVTRGAYMLGAVHRAECVCEEEP